MPADAYAAVAKQRNQSKSLNNARVTACVKLIVASTSFVEKKDRCDRLCDQFTRVG
jgi:hypothetical protein